MATGVVEDSSVQGNSSLQSTQSLSMDEAQLHDVFISYSRRDMAFANALHRALERYVPPRGLLVTHRRLNVFRDVEDFTGTEYYRSVEQHLRRSRRLVVICSPNAYQSKFVDDEIRRFAQARSPANIIPVLIAGLPNHEATPETQAAIAFPVALCEVLKLPLASDYRGFSPSSDRVTSRPWRPAWYKLLADIFGCSRAEIEQRERRRRFRQRLTWSTAAACTLAIAGGLLYFIQVQRRSVASIEFARQATALADSEPEQGVARALEAFSRAPTKAAITALRINLAKLPIRVVKIAKGHSIDTPLSISFAPDGKRLMLVDSESTSRVLEMKTGREEFEIATNGSPITDAHWSADDAILVATDEARKSFVYETSSWRRLAAINGELHLRKSKPESRISAVLFLDNSVQIVELDQPGNWKILREIRPFGYIGPKIKPFESSSRKLSPDGLKLASLVVVGEQGEVVITDLDSGQISRIMLELRAPNELAWSPQGNLIVAKSLFGFSVLDTASAQVSFTKDTPNQISVEDVSFSPNGRLLAITDRGGSAWLWDVAGNKEIAKLVGEETRAYRPTFSSDGRFLGVIYANGRARVFSLDGKPRGGLAKLDSTWGEISSLSFTPGGQFILAAYERGRLVMWDILDWFPEHRLPTQYDPRYRAGVPEGLEDISTTKDGSVIGIQKGNAWERWSAVSGAKIAKQQLDLQRLSDTATVETGGYSLRKAEKAVLISGSEQAATVRLPHSWG